jgi:aspartate/methionine/tyrosine aminotransferase
MSYVDGHNIKVYLTEEQLNKRIAEIGAETTERFKGESVYLVCILKGSIFFTCELAKRITVPVTLDFMSVSSYGDDTKSSGVVKMVKDLDEPLQGKDVIVIEDLAYFCMDFRKDMGHPFQPPYPPTVARYTDNYILMLSSSKIFSYAGQRIALTCISDKLFGRHFPALAQRYKDSGIFGQTLTASILYMITSGCTASTQYAYAEMLRLATEGMINFVEDTREYAIRAQKMKDIFTRNGFHIVYDQDVDQPVGDGFFFTLGYGNLQGGELLKELLYYGVSSISLSTTGSGQQGVRACTSRMKNELYPVMEERMKAFHHDHPIK